MAHRHNRIKKRKLLRFHSKKKYRRKKRGHYSQYKCLRRRTINKKQSKTYSETLLGTKFEHLVVELVKVIFPLEKDAEIKNIFIEAVAKENTCSFTKEYIHKTIRVIHAGFKKAQMLIINNLIEIQQEQSEVKRQIKIARKEKAKDKEAKLSTSLQILGYKESVLKEFANTIFWHLIQGKLHISRRFFQNVPGNKTLEETNYRSVLEVANKINSNPDNFVLLTDITSYVQIGDLFGIVDGKITLIEVKEGDKNIEILEDLSKLRDSIISTETLYEKYKDDPKGFDQISRILKQHKVASDEMNIINTDKGHDPVTDRNIKILTPEEDTLYYYQELSALEKQLSERKFWAYTVVDNSLHIGLYKNKWRYLGKPLLECIAKDQKIEHKILVDIRQVMNTMDSPLLFLPFSKQLIIDVILGKIFMFLMLDIDSFLGLLGNFGISYSWLSRRETTKLKEQIKNLNLYVADNRAIRTTNIHGTEGIMTMGVLAKILFNQIRPTYVAYSLNYFKKDSLS